MPAVGFAGLRQSFDQLVAGGGGGGRRNKDFRRVYFDPLQAESRTAARQRCGFIRMSSLCLKAQHDPAALGVIAAQAAQSVALYVRTGVLLLDLRAKLQC